MDSKDYHKVCEAIDDIAPFISKDSIDNVEDIVLQETNDSLKDNEAGRNEIKMEIDTIEMANEIIEPSVDNKYDVVHKKNVIEKNENAETLMETSFAIVNSISSLEPTTSQDNIPTSSNDIEGRSLSNDQSKIKRSISKGQINGDNGISMDKFGNNSDEDSSKRQKFNESVYVKSIFEDGCLKSNLKFYPSKSDYYTYYKKPSTRETEDSCNEGGPEDVEMRQESKGATASKTTENREQGVGINSNGPDTEEAGENDSIEWTTTSEEELEASEEDLACLKKEKPKPNWFVVPELIRREVGNNPLFQRRYYGSLHVVEHFELMYKLEEHEGCVNTLNFNQKGNLLASGSDDLAVVIWDWAIGKQHHSFCSGHRSNLLQAKWLPFGVDYLMATCARDGQVRLLDIRRGISRKIAMHRAPAHRLAVHPDTPHVIISVGGDAKVLSIDIREEKPTQLLVVNDGSFDVHLYSVNSNPLNSNEFCVGGRSQTVRIYDRRKVSVPLYHLCPYHLTENRHTHVTCAVYNYNATEVLASYNDEDIYLFDVTSRQTKDFVHRYQGHRNNATVKHVNFFGPKSEYVISGSDCGNIFIWDKNTEAIVNWMAGDEQGVVNCLEPHPHIPVLATSGLDFDVKIWMPSCEQPPTMTNLENCVKSNALNRAEDTANESDAIRCEMLWILVSFFGVRNRITRRRPNNRNRDDDDDDDDDDDSSYSSDHSDSRSEVEEVSSPPS